MPRKKFSQDDNLNINAAQEVDDQNENLEQNDKQEQNFDVGNESQPPQPPSGENLHEQPDGDDDFWQFNGVKTLQSDDPNNPGKPVRNCGWKPTPFGMMFRNIEPFQSIEEDLQSNENIRYKGDEVFLWESLWYLFDGKYPAWRWQHTGSCVESGYNNAVKVLIAQEVINDKLPKTYVQPFTFHVYGMSRYIGLNDPSEGEGSFGSSMAEAGSKYGILPIDFPDVDKPVVCGEADAFGAEIEFKWSSIRRHPESIRNVKFPYTIKFVRCGSLQQAETLLRSGCPMTWAGDWGGRSKASVRGSKYPVLFMSRWETWHHQQSCLGMWKHPELGRIWYIQNNWWHPNDTKFELRHGYIWKITKPGNALPAHGQHPKIDVAGWNHPPFPPGGYWIDDANMEYQIRRGEVFGLVLFDGFTGRRISFGNI